MEKSNDTETLMIGKVRCKECGAEWEAMAYKCSLAFLECPECGEENSEVAEEAL